MRMPVSYIYRQSASRATISEKRKVEKGDVVVLAKVSGGAAADSSLSGSHVGPRRPQ